MLYVPSLAVSVPPVYDIEEKDEEIKERKDYYLSAYNEVQNVINTAPAETYNEQLEVQKVAMKEAYEDFIEALDAALQKKGVQINNESTNGQGISL